MTTTVPTQSPGSGFSQSFKRESRKWWRISRWYKQAAIWTILFGLLTFLFFTILSPISWLINLLNTVYELVIDPNPIAIAQLLRRGLSTDVQYSSAALVLPLIFAVAYTIIGQAIIVIFNGQFFDELNRGSLKWSFSRSIKRGAYVVSKALADNLGVFIMTVLIPFGILFIITTIAARENTIPPLNYLATMLLIMLGFVFWHSFVMVLTFTTRRRALSFGIPVILLIFGGLVSRTLDEALGTGTLISQLSPWSSRNYINGLLTGALDFGDPQLITAVVVTAVWAILLYLITWLALRRADL